MNQWIMFEDYILDMEFGVSLETGLFMNRYHTILVVKYGTKFMDERLYLAKEREETILESYD